MLDQIDKYLIERLQENGRQTTSELAHEVGMSVPAVAERQIQSWPGVNRTETRIILSHYKEHGVIRVPDALISHKEIHGKHH